MLTSQIVNPPGPVGCRSFGTAPTLINMFHNAQCFYVVLNQLPIMRNAFMMTRVKFSQFSPHCIIHVHSSINLKDRVWIAKFSWFPSLFGIFKVIYSAYIGESGAKWHPGRIGTPRVSAHVAVANLWRWCFYVAYIPTRIPRTFGSQTRLGLKIIMTNHFWITWVYFFNNS